MFDEWPELQKCYKQGSLLFVDLKFAECILRKISSKAQEHAALISTLFALSRLGHLTLDVSPDSLLFALHRIGIVDIAAISALICKSACDFPLEPWICRLGNRYYLPKSLNDETEILTHIERLAKSTPSIPFSDHLPDSKLNTLQKQAVRKGLTYSVSLLTGGPGTGKTFTASELVIAALSQLTSPKRGEFRIILTAPTGKAVGALEAHLQKHLKGTCFRSGTLHAILGIKEKFQEQSEIFPLFADLILVDECSMIDAKMFARLLASITAGSRLILIGDKDQLPAVDAGSIFADLLESNVYPATRLTQSLRSDRSEILTLGQLIKDGKSQEVISFLQTNPEIVWIELDTAQDFYLLWERYKHKFRSSFSQEPTFDLLHERLGTFSILSCLKSGPSGVDSLNQFFLEQSLKEAHENNYWAAPVIITRNNYDLQLCNGDLGFLVRKISANFSPSTFHLEDYILFSDRKGGHRQISALSLNSFEYSYALSVHKSQGSEYDEILILAPVGSEHFGREVLYTAVTRARKKISLAGSIKVITEVINTSSRKISGIPMRLGS